MINQNITATDISELKSDIVNVFYEYLENRFGEKHMEKIKGDREYVLKKQRCDRAFEVDIIHIVDKFVKKHNLLNSQ
jgi:hypothetical protein